MGINRNQAERMQVLLASADTSENSSLSELVRPHGWSPQVAVSIAELENRLRGDDFHAVILDIDSLAADNRTISRLAAASPRVAFLCISRERLHPQLQESIRKHVFACLTKPIDPEELGYWLKCIREDSRYQVTENRSENPNPKRRRHEKG
jgi:DNA-binding NtrC family response regulator